MSFFFSNPLDEAVDKATSENLPIGTEDLVLNLEIADKIKAKEVSGKQAVQSLRRRVNHKNPNVQLLALKLTDTCVKNSGHHFVQEVASREFTDNLVSIARAPIGTNPDVRQKILALIQSWGLAFKTKSDLRYVTEVYESLKQEGITFPPVERAESSAAMIETTTAPEWTDSDVCMRCRTQFTTFNRKHHCRNCGQTFCGQCSAKTLALAHLGIVQEVRVCDTCHLKLTSKSPPGTPHQPRASSLPMPRDNDAARKEEEDIQRAIALSLEAGKSQSSYRPAAVTQPKPKPVVRDEEEDEDLKAAIAASLQDVKSDYTTDRPTYEYKTPNAAVSQPVRRDSVPASSPPAYNPNELSAVELENIRLFSELVERTEADVATHGLGVLGHSQIQTLYAQIATMQPKLARNLDETVRQYGTFYDLHEQLTAATKEYDRMLQERLAAAGYAQPYVAAPREYQQYTQSPLPNSYQPQPPAAGYNAAPAPSSYAPGYGAPPTPGQPGGYYGAPAQSDHPQLHAQASAGMLPHQYAQYAQSQPGMAPPQNYQDPSQQPQPSGIAADQYQNIPQSPPQQPLSGPALNQPQDVQPQQLPSVPPGGAPGQYYDPNQQGVTYQQPPAPQQYPVEAIPQQQTGAAPYYANQNSAQHPQGSFAPSHIPGPGDAAAAPAGYPPQNPQQQQQQQPQQQPQPQQQAAAPPAQGSTTYTYTQPPTHSFAPQHGQPPATPPQQYLPQAYAPQQPVGYAPTAHPIPAPVVQQAPPPPQPEAPLIEL
ncbi:hypothetical protein SpCBS45565_g00682 [Spizellomyces sp. 'palustris']|nr:hypothetical protein SpCBS45565_g00682 [Spizellomyces sp. 'palustris']